MACQARMKARQFPFKVEISGGVLFVKVVATSDSEAKERLGLAFRGFGIEIRGVVFLQAALSDSQTNGIVTGSGMWLPHKVPEFVSGDRGEWEKRLETLGITEQHQRAMKGLVSRASRRN